MGRGEAWAPRLCLAVGDLTNRPDRPSPHPNNPKPSVLTVRDFTMVFDAYSQCEEALLSARVALLEDDDDEEEVRGGEGRGGGRLWFRVPRGHVMACVSPPALTLRRRQRQQHQEEEDDDLDVEGDDTELRLARLEDLMERRPVMVRGRLAGWLPVPASCRSVHPSHDPFRFYSTPAMNQSIDGWIESAVVGAAEAEPAQRARVAQARQALRAGPAQGKGEGGGREGPRGVLTDWLIGWLAD